MATLKQMLDKAGSIENAEATARFFVEDRGDEYLLDLGLVLAAQGKTEEAWQTLQQAEKTFPGEDRVAYNKGWHLMLQGDLLGGFELMNRGRAIEIWGNAHIGSVKPIWNGEPIEGKHLLFYCEAGLGDGVIFVRFAREFAKMGAKVTVVCAPELASLFARIPEISSIVEPKAMLGVYHDYWMPSMRAPVALKTQFEDLSTDSYIKSDPFYVKKFKTIIRGDELKIGIRWLGRKGDDYIGRIFSPELMFDTVNQKGTKVYSLQKADHNNTELPEWLVDLDPHLNTWEDTVGAIENLDLVVSSCTSVAHMAATMGKPTWVITPVMMYYIWCCPGNKSPWYKDVTLFRQEKWAEWEDAFKNIKKELNILIQGE